MTVPARAAARPWLLAALVFMAAMVVAACSSSGPASTAAASTASASGSPSSSQVAASASTRPSASHRVTHRPSPRPSHPSPRASVPADPARPPAVPAGRPLAGRVVLLDPGHNGANGTHLAQINQLVNIVNGWKACDTTGTATNSGYTESAFNFDVALRTAAILRAEGATVVLTRSSDSGVGPCINQRAAIGNLAHAAAAVSIHADGGPPTGVGFQVILPGDVGPNAGIIAASDRLGSWLHAAFHSVTAEPYATYLGGGSGYTTRTDLGGLNLSTVPKVFIECANMRSASDAGRVVSSSWRQLAAAGISSGITHFLLGR